MKGLFKYIVLILAFALLAVLLQSSVLRMILPVWAVPNFILISVVFLAFRLPTARGALIAFALGLLLDVSSAQLLGPNAGAFVAVFGLLAALSQRLFVQAPVTLACTIFGASVLSSLIFMLMTYEYKSIGGHVLLGLFGQAIVTAIVSPLVIAGLNRLVKPDRDIGATSSHRRGRR